MSVSNRTHNVYFMPQKWRCIIYFRYGLNYGRFGRLMYWIWVTWLPKRVWNMTQNRTFMSQISSQFKAGASMLVNKNCKICSSYMSRCSPNAKYCPTCSQLSRTEKKRRIQYKPLAYSKTDFVNAPKDQKLSMVYEMLEQMQSQLYLQPNKKS